MVVPGPGRVTILLSAGRPPSRLVLKVADLEDTQVDFGRTVAAMTSARAVGVPVAAVVAADTTGRLGPWQYLLQEHVDGAEWRAVRSRLDADQLAAAHRQIADVVLALRSVPLPTYGEIPSAVPSTAASVVTGPATGMVTAAVTAPPTAAGLLPALRERAGLRIVDPGRRALFLDVLDREAGLFSDPQPPVLVHDDLHHANLVFRAEAGEYALAGVLDWDKAWSGPGESDIARMAFWDDMTGPAFWHAYRAAFPLAPGEPERLLVHQLLWCLEYDTRTARHLADTAAVCDRLGVTPPRS